MRSVLFKSKLFAGWRRELEPSSVSCGYNAPSVKRIGVTSSKVISVFMGGLTIKKAYDRICLEDFRQTCFGRVVGVWGRRGSIAFLIFYGSKFNVGWFYRCHPGCNELRIITACSGFLKCPRIVSMHKKTKQWQHVVQGGNFSLTNSRTEKPRALFFTFYLINRGKKAFDLEHYSSTG